MALALIAPALALARGQARQAAHDIAHLAFQHEYNAGRRIGVGAVEHEKIWKSCLGDAQIGLGTALPDLAELHIGPAR